MGEKERRGATGDLAKTGDAVRRAGIGSPSIYRIRP
jgi:hypothetical protein